MTGYDAAGEFTTALVIVGMQAEVALVPIGIGALLLLSDGRKPSAAEARPAGRGWERLGWTLATSGLVVLVLTVVSRVITGDDWLVYVGSLGVGLLGVGIWTVVSERRHPGLTTPDVDAALTRSDDRELQDHT